MIAVSYIMKRKIKKIFFEVISYYKIFNIIFFQRNGQRSRFSQTYRGAKQRRIRYLIKCLLSTKIYKKCLTKSIVAPQESI